MIIVDYRRKFCASFPPLLFPFAKSIKSPRIAQIFLNDGTIAATAPHEIASRNAVAENAIRLPGLFVAARWGPA